jgi:predicted Zn-dependent protease
MKKKMISFASLGLVLATFFLSCETSNHAAEEQLETALATPAKIISNAQAITLYKNDQNTRLSQIGKKDVRFEDKVIHFDLQTLESYINQLETLKASKNIPITGANFVFGADQNGNRTLFLMPSTRNAELDYQESFTIENGQFLTFKHVDPTMKAQLSSQNDMNLILSPNGYLSFNEAATLFNKYQTQYIQPFAKKVVKDYYTKAVWYSIEEFKDYLTYLKYQSDKHNLGITAVDVFFGVYNNDPSLELKSNAQTVFLAANVKTRDYCKCLWKVNEILV